LLALTAHHWHSRVSESTGAAPLRVRRSVNCDDDRHGPCCPTFDAIDSELRLLAAVRWSIREHGGEPSSRQVDELLDERLEISASSVR